MKAFAILPAAAAAILALNISTAASQGACQQEYQACMTACSTKPLKALHGACFEGCEGKNNLCAERIYGKRPFNGAPSTAAEQRGQSKDAMARTPKEQVQQAREEAAQPQAREQQAPQQAPQGQPETRGQARR